MVGLGDVSRPDIFLVDGTIRLGVSRNLVLITWRDAPLAVHAHAMRRALVAAAQRYPADFGVFNVVAAGTPNFKDEVRSEMAKIVADPVLQGHGAAHAVLLDGFAGIATKAFMSTLFLIGRGTKSNKVFGDLRSAAAWLAPRLSAGKERWTEDDILAADDALGRAPPS